jgi:hypothetical protein
MAAVAVVFDGSSSIRRHLKALAMDYNERTRGRRKDRQYNNQPARCGERAVQREDDKR